MLIVMDKIGAFSWKHYLLKESCCNLSCIT